MTEGITRATIAYSRQVEAVNQFAVIIKRIAVTSIQLVKVQIRFAVTSIKLADAYIQIALAQTRAAYM
jgi:hypothetical protein